jgi:hypothetical protein
LSNNRCTTLLPILASDAAVASQLAADSSTAPQRLTPSVPPPPFVNPVPQSSLPEDYRFLSIAFGTAALMAFALAFFHNWGTTRTRQRGLPRRRQDHVAKVEWLQNVAPRHGNGPPRHGNDNQRRYNPLGPNYGGKKTYKHRRDMKQKKYTNKRNHKRNSRKNKKGSNKNKKYKKPKRTIKRKVTV